MNSSAQIHADIKDLIISGENRPTESDYNISSLRSEMEQKIDRLTQDAEDVENRLSETRELALEWEASAQQLLDEELSSPVQNSSMQWNEESDDPPSFSIDSQQASSNRENLTELREALDELDKKYRAAIDSVSNYIRSH
ncbi:MAG: hypothetical protein U5K72_15180 [Balneolaceae bacterium]|nr:hypothetical protein [Balneolaceae bacterium]